MATSQQLVRAGRDSGRATALLKRVPSELVEIGKNGITILEAYQQLVLEEGLLSQKAKDAREVVETASVKPLRVVVGFMSAINNADAIALAKDKFAAETE